MSPSIYQYHVGGSLPPNSPTYITRQADFELYEKLQNGEFCYVLNSRQMGKSSLLVHTMEKLINDGFICATIDLSDLGSQQVSLEQWYGGLAYKILSNFNLFNPLEFMSWWGDRSFLSPVQRLADLIDNLILSQIDSKIVIFIDEIDNTLSFSEPLDDFFALIRSCYNKRAQNPNYERLTFALLGVATPSALIADPTRTPFNIGHAINLPGFQLTECGELITGLREKFADPVVTMEVILTWSGGQPFLTQKLCNLVRNYGQENLSPSLCVEQIVNDKIINNWESQDEPTHLKTIRDRILRNSQKSNRVLGLYQKILERGEIPADNSPEQSELRLSGLVLLQDGKLKIYNQIYEKIFDLTWVKNLILNLCPYAEALTAWIGNNCQDDSRLLRGKALQEALNWSAGKSLSNQAYQFLAASQEAEMLELRKKEAQSRAEIEVLCREKELLEQLSREQEQRKLAEAKFEHERELRRAVRKAVDLRALVGLGLFMILLGEITSLKFLFERTNTDINTQVLYAESLLNSHRPIDALIQSLRAGIRGQRLLGVRRDNWWRTILTINENVDSLEPPVIWQIPQGYVQQLFFPNQGEFLLTVNSDRTLQFWQYRQRQLIQNFPKLGANFSISKDGEMVAIIENNQVKISQINGDLVKTLNDHIENNATVIFSEDQAKLVSLEQDNSIKIWQINQDKIIDKFVVKSGKINSISLSYKADKIVTGDADGNINIWQDKLGLIATVKGHKQAINQVIFSPDHTIIASASQDGTVKLWNQELILFGILPHHAAITSLIFSPDSEVLVTGTSDGKVNFWHREGGLLKSINAHKKAVATLNFRSDGKMLISTSKDGQIKRWNLDLDDLLQRGCILAKDYLEGDLKSVIIGEKIDRSIRDKIPLVCDMINPKEIKY